MEPEGTQAEWVNVQSVLMHEYQAVHAGVHVHTAAGCRLKESTVIQRLVPLPPLPPRSATPSPSPLTSHLSP